MTSLGGEPYDEAGYKAAHLRADLCEVATAVSYTHGCKVVDAILAKYDVKRKR